MPSSIKGAYVGNDKLYPITVSNDQRSINLNGKTYSTGSNAISSLIGTSGTIYKHGSLNLVADDSSYAYNIPYANAATDSFGNVSLSYTTPPSTFRINAQGDRSGTYTIKKIVVDQSKRVWLYAYCTYQQYSVTDKTDDGTYWMAYSDLIQDN